MGAAKTKTQTNARWFVTFIDDHTRTTWVYLMKEKSEVNQIFQSFYSYVKNQFHTSIQILRSDNAKEYLSSSMKEFLTKQGIHHQTSCVYTPQQNGVAERKNRHLLKVTRAIMIERNVPKIFWVEMLSLPLPTLSIVCHPKFSISLLLYRNSLKPTPTLHSFIPYLQKLLGV